MCICNKKPNQQTKWYTMFFVGIFYPYKHFKSDCKLFGHPNFHQWGQTWCWKSAFSFLKWAFNSLSSHSKELNGPLVLYNYFLPVERVFNFNFSLKVFKKWCYWGPLGVENQHFLSWNGDFIHQAAIRGI